MVLDQNKSSLIQTSSCYCVNDEYIDIELSSSKSLLCFSPQSKEFEFQMGSVNNLQETITSSADELFFQGKLLPLLHIPPPLQTVQNLHHHHHLPNAAATKNHKTKPFQEKYLSPFESCNISLSEIQDHHLFEISTNRKSLIGFSNDPVVNKSWTKKLQKSLLGKKLAYLKSLFSNNTDHTININSFEHSCVKSSRDCDENFKNNGCLIRNQIKVRKKNSSFGENLMKSIERDMFHSQRRSFSGAILQRYSTNTSSCNSSVSSSSSSSFSFSSSHSQGFCDLQLLKRSSSANSDIESSIEGAIAHCKKTQQPLILLKED